MKIPLPKGKYIKNIVINEDNLDVEFSKRKKIALVLIGINDRYWGYLKQVIEDCRINFLPQHNVDYFVWTDIPQEDTEEFRNRLNSLLTDEELAQVRTSIGAVPNNQYFGRETIQGAVDFMRNSKDITITPTDGIDWPAPTLMRYHLFLNQEEKLKEYDYIFYLDADMRVVDKISDEILGEELTAAPHPGYVLSSRMLPPYEPNKDSKAYIDRLGYVGKDERGNTRFIPFYAAGGFQGGKAKDFIKAMHVLKRNIDADFDRNYIAIWNDESHWNKYLWDFQKKGGNVTFLDVSYVYPDSLIKEYYEPIWGRSYQPKIITLTKPFSLSTKAGSELNQILGLKGEEPKISKCPKCGDGFSTPGYSIKRIVQCPGTGKAHQLDMQKI